MNMATIVVSGVYAHARMYSTIPAGIVGATVTFEFTDPIWEELTKIAVFQGAETRDVILTGNTATIPAETVAKAGPMLKVGIYGVDAENNLVIPTLWAAIGGIRDAADPSGDPGTDPELPIWAQLADRVEGIAKDVEELQQTGGAGPGTPGAPGADGGYYTPAVTQLDEDTIQFAFTPSKEDMPAVNPVTVELPVGQGSGGNVDEEQIAAAVNKWLDEHPEATTTTKWSDIADGEIFELSTEEAPEFPVPCTGITLDQTELSFIDTETTVTLVATVTPDDTTEQIEWSVDNSDVATVENGVVKAIANGSCVITATCGAYSATCVVTVEIDASYVDYTKENLDGYFDFIGVENGYFGTLTNKAENGTLTGEIKKSTNKEEANDPASVEDGVLVLDYVDYMGGAGKATQMLVYDADTEKFYTTYPYSVEFYGKLNSNTDMLMSTRSNGGVGTNVAFSDDSTIKTAGAVGQGNNTIVLASAVDVTTYRHYVVCVDRALVRVYIDGVMMGEGTAGNNAAASSGPLYLLTRHCRFKMCRVYNAILTDEQVAKNYANTIAVYGGDA